MIKLLHRFIADDRGNVAITATILLLVIMGIMAVAVDLGSLFIARRKAQATTDLAAISAATTLSAAASVALSTLKSNSYPADTSLAVEVGIYNPDLAVPPSRRFQPASVSSANAAQVTMKSTTPIYFARPFMGTDRIAITTKATATSTVLTSFAIGSRLVQINGGMGNQILGSMLGSNVSLSAMDYQSLSDAKIDMFDFTNAVATRARLTGPTYGSALGTSVQVGTVFQAMVDVVRANGNNQATVAAASQLSSAASNSTVKIPLQSLLNLGPYATLPLGQKPQKSASIGALDLAKVVAQLANGQNQASVAVNLGIPEISSATLKIAIGQPAVGKSWMQVGTVGTSVYTSQTRISLTAQLTGQIGSVNLPIYIEVGTGTAKLTAAACGYPDVSRSTVTLGVTPGIVDAWIGNLSNTDFNDMRSPLAPASAALVNTTTLKASGRSHVAVSNPSPTAVSFTFNDIESQTKKTVTTNSYATSLATSLFRNLSMDVQGDAGGLATSQSTQQAVANTLSQVAAPLDAKLASILSMLGVGLGQADVWIAGLRCDGAVLVN